MTQAKPNPRFKRDLPETQPEPAGFICLKMKLPEGYAKAGIQAKRYKNRYRWRHSAGMRQFECTNKKACY
jgi:hypothetical protein